MDDTIPAYTTLSKFNQAILNLRETGILPPLCAEEERRDEFTRFDEVWVKKSGAKDIVLAGKTECGLVVFGASTFPYKSIAPRVKVNKADDAFLSKWTHFTADYEIAESKAVDKIEFKKLKYGKGTMEEPRYADTTEWLIALKTSGVDLDIDIDI